MDTFEFMERNGKNGFFYVSKYEEEDCHPPKAKNRLTTRQIEEILYKQFFKVDLLSLRRIMERRR